MVQNERTIDFDELQAFSHVVRHGGITAAGRALGLSKSAISMQITRLEKRLGVRLFERNSRRVTLTREGEHLLPRVQSILAEADQLLDETTRARTLPQGTVRVAMPPALGGAVLDHLVPALAERYPDISLVVTPNYDVDDLQDPAFDFAVRVGKIGDEGLVGHLLGSFTRILVASSGWPDIPHDIAGLGDLPLLAFSGQSTRIDWRLQADPSDDIVTLNRQAKVSVRDFELLLRLVRAGQGVTMVPDFMVRDELAEGRIRHILPAWRSPAVEVLLAHRVGASRIGRVAAAMDLTRLAVSRVLQGGA